MAFCFHFNLNIVLVIA